MIRPGLDTHVHDPKTFKASDYALACQTGTCSCAPTCPVCGKQKCWDAKVWPGLHDWRCNECHQTNLRIAWKPA